MAENDLYILVEGPDDHRFVHDILSPIFERKYSNVIIYKYRNTANHKIRILLRSLMNQHTPYLFLSDLDDIPCVTERKYGIQMQYGPLNHDRIVVVKREIEGWYLGGLTHKACKSLKISTLPGTDYVSKEDLRSLMEDKYRSKDDFLSEILKRYDINQAKIKNASFRYFLKRHVDFS